MRIDQPGIYHIYNRGNFRQQLFFNDRHYHYFLTKCHLYLKTKAEILAWCLMPNHFHFLIQVTEISLEPVKVGSIEMPAITNGFRLLQSAYAKGINKEMSRTGNLFQQKTKAKVVSGPPDYTLAAFHYIHQNPLAAGLVKSLPDWEYSSLKDYAGLRNGTLCNKVLTAQLLGVDMFIPGTSHLNEDDIKSIF